MRGPVRGLAARTSVPAAALSTLALLAALPGCPGRDTDSGPGPGADSAPGVDSGPGTDSAPGVDSGPGPGTDSALGVDSGPMCTPGTDCQGTLCGNGNVCCNGVCCAAGQECCEGVPFPCPTCGGGGGGGCPIG